MMLLRGDFLMTERPQKLIFKAGNPFKAGTAVTVPDGSIQTIHASAGFPDDPDYPVSRHPTEDKYGCAIGPHGNKQRGAKTLIGYLKQNGITPLVHKATQGDTEYIVAIEIDAPDVDRAIELAQGIKAPAAVVSKAAADEAPAVVSKNIAPPTAPACGPKSTDGPVFDVDQIFSW
jgi:hypothetical protein